MPNISVETFACLLSVCGLLLGMALLGTELIPAKALSAVETRMQLLSRRRGVLLISIPVCSLLLNIAIATKTGLPRPHIQDEFSYLLAADTFAAGRLTNPTPAYWEHFETEHELMRPTYMSKYPPGQALSLALGLVTTGLPIVGVWLCTAGGCVMIYWMLLGFVNQTWAMVGAFLSVLHPLLGDWSRIYWGGSVAFLGGAIVLGAWVRLLARASAGAAVMLGIGLVVLANSRPFEGLMLVIPLMLALVWHAAEGGRFKSYFVRVAIPLVAVLLPAAVAMGYYNYRVTGHALEMPFMEYARQYDVYPKFWFFARHAEPVYRNDSMRAIHTVYERGDYDELRTIGGLMRISCRKAEKLILMYADPWVLMLPLLVAVPTIRHPILRWVWLSVLTLLIGLWAETFFLDHYAAPVSAALLLLIVVGWERLWHWNCRGKPMGRFIAIGVGLGFAVAAVFFSISVPVDAGLNRVEQSALISQAESLQSGRHLIFVRYGPGHWIHDEWVHNEPDIKHSRIIWARFMGPQADAPVAHYFARREIWILTVGKDDLTLHAYSLPS